MIALYSFRFFVNVKSIIIGDRCNSGRPKINKFPHKISSANTFPTIRQSACPKDLRLSSVLTRTASGTMFTCAGTGNVSVGSIMRIVHL
jgi:hypothetical protein